MKLTNLSTSFPEEIKYFPSLRRRIEYSFRSDGFRMISKVTKQFGIHLKDGNYTGALGNLYRNETDYELTSEHYNPNDFNFIGKRKEDNYVIMSHEDDGKAEMQEITSSLFMFSPLINAFIISIIFTMIIAYKKLYKTGYLTAGLKIISNTVQQNVSYSINGRYRLYPLISIWSLTIFMITHIFYANFKTDRVSIAPPNYIDTLDDLIATGRQPLFIDLYSIHGDFQAGRTSTYAKVWSKCKGKQSESCIYHSREFDRRGNKKIASRLKKGNVMIIKEHEADFLKTYLCNERGLHISRPFITRAQHLIANRYLPVDVERKLRETFRRTDEHGLFTPIERKFHRELLKMAHVRSMCSKNAYSLNEEEHIGVDNKIYIEDTKLLFAFFILSTLLSLLVFICENIYHLF